MKINFKLIALSYLTYFILVPSIYAVTINPSPTDIPTRTPTPNPIEKQIDSLTNKIASRVAQLKLVEKRGVIGEVTDVSSTQITVNNLHGNTQFVDVDEFTKFSSSSSKSFGISDIKKGDKLGVLGLYNKESRRILARFVDIIILPRIIHGTVSDIDAKNFTLGLASQDGKETTVDVQPSTKTFSFSSSASSLTKSGFSKIEIGQRIVAVGFPDKKDLELFEASKIITLPDLAPNPKIKISIPQASPTPTIKSKPPLTSQP